MSSRSSIRLAAAITVSTTLATPASAYPIDCAILLCLAGGFPASPECTAARAEFIRRVTPWPIEPPLQIWRCPMQANFEGGNKLGPRIRVYEAFLNRGVSPYPLASAALTDASLAAQPAVANGDGRSAHSLPDGYEIQLAEDIGQGADRDISDPTFDFVRSIKVYDIRINRNERDNGSCQSSSNVRLGKYSIQGQFSWSNEEVWNIPSTYQAPARAGCNPSVERAVFVEWADHEGTYDFEQVNY